MLRRAAFAACLSTFLFAASAFAAPPRPAPPVYATHNYGLTFRTPPGATYCPLPADWVGSDHGTLLFLERPVRCDDEAGYASSGRGFSPDNLALISLYYGYVTDDSPPPPCHAVGRLSLLGRMRPLCRDRNRGMIRLSVRTTYRLDKTAVSSEAVLTLVTRGNRLARDLATFRRMAASLHTCSSLWPATSGHPAFILGFGRRCPAGVIWF